MEVSYQTANGMDLLIGWRQPAGDCNAIVGLLKSRKYGCNNGPPVNLDNGQQGLTFKIPLLQNPMSHVSGNNCTSQSRHRVIPNCLPCAMSHLGK